MESRIKYRRTHNILLISRLLSCRENASPFTLIVDSLAQSGKPMTWEIVKRAKVVEMNQY